MERPSDGHYVLAQGSGAAVGARCAARQELAEGMAGAAIRIHHARSFRPRFALPKYASFASLVTLRTCRPYESHASTRISTYFRQCRGSTVHDLGATAVAPRMPTSNRNHAIGMAAPRVGRPLSCEARAGAGPDCAWGDSTPQVLGGGPHPQRA